MNARVYMRAPARPGFKLLRWTFFAVQALEERTPFLRLGLFLAFSYALLASVYTLGWYALPIVAVGWAAFLAYGVLHGLIVASEESFGEQALAALGMVAGVFFFGALCERAIEPGNSVSPLWVMSVCLLGTFALGLVLWIIELRWPRRAATIWHACRRLLRHTTNGWDEVTKAWTGRRVA